MNGIDPDTGNICATGTDTSGDGSGGGGVSQNSVSQQPPQDPGLLSYVWGLLTSFGGPNGPSSPPPPVIRTSTSTASCQPIQKGFGMGLTGGASAGGGLGPMHSLGGTLTGGAGVFHSPSGYSSGGFASAGGFTAAKGNLGNYPANSTSIPNFGLGAFAGVGGGVFFTNAGNVASLSGPFTTVMLGLPPIGGIPGIGVEFDYSQGIGVLSITGGKSIGLPAGLMVLQTNTFYTTSNVCKQ